MYNVAAPSFPPTLKIGRIWSCDYFPSQSDLVSCLLVEVSHLSFMSLYQLEYASNHMHIYHTIPEN